MNLYISRMKNSEDYIVFLPETLQLFSINAYTIPIVQNVADGMTYNEAKKEFTELTEEMYTKIYTVLHTKKKCISEKMPSDTLYRLVINISNNCNMGCKYCYANEGVYCSSQNLMDCQMAELILDKFYSVFDTIETIQLFGGEPCLNIPVIKLVCEYIKRNVKNTAIGMVTNGTILTDELLELIKKYNILVTVSLDHENIHDLLRPYKNNLTGTYEKIISNIKKMQTKTKQPQQIEATYTKLHETMGISVTDVLESIQQHVGNVPVHIVPVCTEQEEYQITDTKKFVDSISDYFEKIKNGKPVIKHSYVDRFISPFFEQCPSSRFCSAGEGTLSVSTTGKIYSCFYFTDQKDDEIANIEEKVEDIKRKIAARRMLSYDKMGVISNKCNNCFANSVCYNCLGVNQSETGNRYIMSDFNCRLIKDGLQRTLEELVHTSFTTPTGIHKLQ